MVNNANNLTAGITESFAAFGGFMGYMPNPDWLIREKGVDFEIFREMLNDAHIYAKLQQLYAQVINMKPVVEGANADLVKKQLKSLNLRNIVMEMMSAVEFGYSVLEVVWKEPELTNGEYVVKSVTGRRQEVFRFGMKGELLYAPSLGGQSELSEEYKFIVTRHGYRNGNYYGSPVLSKCYWPWMFKKAGLRFWVTAAEKFGVPTAVALFHSDDEETLSERASEIASMLSQIKSDAALALGNVDDIRTLEAGGSGYEMFSDLTGFCNDEMSKAVTGETLTSDSGRSGSYSLGAVHSDTLMSRADGLASEIAASLNSTLVKWIVELNMGAGAEAPVLSFERISKATHEQVMAAIDRNVAVSADALYEDYGIPRPKDASDAFQRG
jgi:phage gp29-like protein